MEKVRAMIASLLSKRPISWLASLGLCVAIAGPAVSSSHDAASNPASSFITLGTKGGPEAEAGRSQPANALIVGSDVYLVDAGDGAAQQLVRAGFPLGRVRGIFISHLHFDHTGGLAAILGLRFQMGTPGPLAIFGPPGTKELVSGLIASMQPEARIGNAVPGEVYRDPAASVNVTELVDGGALTLDRLSVKVRGNSHYSRPETTKEAGHSISLSFRFGLPDRVIVYTGDTGPSKAVEQLAQGADLLVSEMIDFGSMEAHIKALGLPSARAEQIIWHLKAHHLTAADVGSLARVAGVKSVVVTHLAGLPPPGSNEMGYLAEIRRQYPGPVAIAEDLDRF